MTRRMCNCDVFFSCTLFTWLSVWLAMPKELPEQCLTEALPYLLLLDKHLG